MTLYFYTQEPFENSLFDIFDDNDDFFFNHHHHIISGCPRHHHGCHGPNSHLDYCKNPYHTTEKQLLKDFNDTYKIFHFEEFTPKINLSEDEKNYYIHADLPGMKKEQIKMDIDEERILTISGEREALFHNNTNTDNDTDKNDTINTTSNNNDNNNENDGMNNNHQSEQESNEGKENDSKSESEPNNEMEVDEKSKDEKIEEERQYSKIECSYGKFKRSFQIPEDGNLETIQAKLENGVLEIIINKIEPPKKQNRTIQIQ